MRLVLGEEPPDPGGRSPGAVDALGIGPGALIAVVGLDEHYQSPAHVRTQQCSRRSSGAHGSSWAKPRAAESGTRRLIAEEASCGVLLPRDRGRADGNARAESDSGT